MNTYKIYLDLKAGSRSRFMISSEITTRGRYRLIEIAVTANVPRTVLHRAKVVDKHATAAIFKQIMALVFDNFVVAPGDYPYVMDVIAAAISHEIDGLSPRVRQDHLKDRKVVKMNPLHIKWEALPFSEL